MLLHQSFKLQINIQILKKTACERNDVKQNMKTAIKQAKNVKKKGKKKSTITKILAVQYVVYPSTYLFFHMKNNQKIY